MKNWRMVCLTRGNLDRFGSAVSLRGPMCEASGSPLIGAITTNTECLDAELSVVLRMEQLAEAAGPFLLLGFALAYAIGAFLLAAVTVRVSPRGWMGRNFRKYLWLIPLSPFVYLLSAIGLLFRGLGAALGFVAEIFRKAFEMATGQRTYRRQKRYSKYYYKSSDNEIDEWFGK